MLSYRDGTPGVKHAVLINGSNFPPYYFENVAMAHRILLENGYKKENIHIFDTALPFPLSLFMEKPYPVQGPAALTEIKEQFRELSRIVTPEDHLFVYATDHGKEKKKRCGFHSIEVSTLVLEDNSIDEIDFAKLLEGIRPKIGIFLFDQCYSGGFAQRLAGKGRVTIAACSPHESSNGNTFPKAFFSAFWKKAGDADHDGIVSIKEAFSFALKHDENAVDGEQNPVMVYQVECETFL
jgi:hypothetical protein